MMRWWLLTTAVVLSSLAALTYLAWSSMPPLAQYYLQPEAEAELARLIPSVSILGHPILVPQIAIVLRSQGGGWQWFALPAAAVRASLAAAYPMPLTTLAFRVLAIALVQTSIVLVVAWTGLRAAVLATRRPSRAVSPSR
jgi:hypothetical protein